MNQKKKKMPGWRMLSFILISCITLASLPVTPLWAAEETESANVTAEDENNLEPGQVEETIGAEQDISDPEITEETDAREENEAASEEDGSVSDEVETLSGNTDETFNNVCTEENRPISEERASEARAETTALNGSCGKDGGDNVKWVLQPDGAYNTLIIRGAGEMEDYDNKNLPWSMYGDSIRTITIENGVTNIGNRAFWGCGKGSYITTNVNIPNSVTKIGDKAFYDCNRIVNIDIPDSVTRIGNSAFCDCIQLTNVKMSNNIESIGEYAFYRCSYLSNIDLPDSISEIGRYAFWGCDDLTSIDIPGSITKIETNTFSGCGDLTNVRLSDGLTIIGAEAFSGCSRLTNINLPNSVISIGVNAFSHCHNLPSIFIPKRITSIAPGAFYNCTNLKDIYYEGGPISWKSLDNYIATNTFNDGFVIGHYTGSPHTAKIHFNSRAEDRKQQYAIPYPNDNDRAQEVFDCSLEECVNKTNSTTYNPQLAHMSIALCNAVHSGGYTEDAYRNFGFDAYTRIGDNLLTYGVGTKRIGNETLVLVIVRGTVNIEEIVDNFNTGVDQSYHQGFHDAADVLYNGVVGFLQQRGLDINSDDLKFVLTGHSRGAAAANIVAARFVNEGIPQNNIYAYTFACPDVAVMSKSTINSYQCIFNIGNIRDIISWIPRAIWTESGEKNGLGRDSFWDKYGRSYWYCEEGYSGHSKDNDISLDLTRSLDEHSQIGYLYQLRNEHQINDYADRERATRLADLSLINGFGHTLQAGHKAYKFCRFFGFACPVDVEVRTSGGQLAGKVINNKPEETMPDKIRIYVEGDKKYVYILDRGDYTFHLTGTDDGTMEYSLREFNTETRQITTEKTFTRVVLTRGKQMISQAAGYTSASSDSGENISGTQLIVLDDKGKPDKEVLPDGKGTEVDVDAPDISPSPSGRPRPLTTPGGGDRKPVVKVKSIKITGPSKKVAAGKKIALKASVSPSNATNKAVVWRSSNTKYVTVNSKGVVTIKKTAGGKTIIITATAKDGSKKKASYKIQCMKGIVKKVAISGKKTRSIKAGKTVKLKAIIKATKGANKTLKWSSSNTKYATVDSKGKVTAKKAGKGKTVRITASATDGSGKKASVKIRIKSS